MTDSVEWLRNLARNYADGVPGMEPQDHHAWAIADEIERLLADKAAISQTASDYLHEIERLKRGRS